MNFALGWNRNRWPAAISTLLLVVGAVFLLYFCPPGADKTPYVTPAVRIEHPGLPNTYRVSPQLFRGAQPRKDGYAELKRLGVKTVVCLRRKNEGESLGRAAGLQYIHLGMNAFFPKKEKFSRFLAVVSDPAHQPVFVHCLHGADRTGTAVALFRIHLQGWTVDEALREMTEGPFGFHSLHRHLLRFIRKFRWQVSCALPSG